MNNVANSGFRNVRNESNHSGKRYAKESDSLARSDQVEAGSVVYCSNLLGIPHRHVHYPSHHTTCSKLEVWSYFIHGV